MDKNNRGQKTITNILTSLLLQIITIVCSFIIPKLMISTYGSDVNGLITSITRFLAYIALIETSGSTVIIANLFNPIANKNKNEIESILKVAEDFFKKIACVLIVYVLILCIVFPLILKNEFSSLFTISLIIIISMSTFAEYYIGMVYSIFLKAKQKQYVVFVIQIVTLLLNAIVIIILVHFNVSVHIVKLVSTCIFVLRPIIQSIYVKKKYNINLKNVTGNYEIKQKWDVVAHTTAYMIHLNIDVVILTLLGDLKEVSVYSIYLIIINGIENILNSFTRGIESAFGDMIAKNEKDNLNKTFKVHEGLYLTFSTILFASTFFLILPFVKVYTMGFNDVSYIRPTFSYLIVIAEFMYMIRQLYNVLVRVGGHFKQTKRSALIEAAINVGISFILVWKLGLVGVAIGTLVAMTYRTVVFIYYVSKNILDREVWYGFKRVLVIICEFLIIAFIITKLPQVEIIDYKTWIIQAIKTTAVSTIVVVIINSVIYKDNIKNIILLVKNLKKNNK